MEVGASSLGKNVFEKHLVARKYKKHRGKKILLLSLSLTAMVDMFSVLVIFLLQAFSATPELMVVGKGIVLPKAGHSDMILDAPVLSISKKEVHLDQKLVGETPSILKNPRPLMLELEKLRNLWAKSHPNKEFPGEISLQADIGMPSTTISQVMAMLPSQAYSSIQLAVVSGGAK